MTEEVNLLIAFGAGLLSFLSPCVLPLIPSYLSFVGGVEFTDLSSGQIDRKRIVWRTVAFVCGFTVVFVSLGVLVSTTTLLFSGVGSWINGAAGMIVVILGLNIVFNFISLLNFEKRVHMRNRPSGYIGAGVVGMAFGAGWSPCIGPILASILLLAGTSGEISKGVALLSVYSLGLGLPFLAAAVAFSSVSRQINRLKRHLRTIRILSGTFLVIMGLLIAFGRFQLLNAMLIRWGYGLITWSTNQPVAARWWMTTLVGSAALVWPVLRLVRRQDFRHPIALPLSAILLLVALLQGFALLDLARLLGSWLTYQGL